MEANQNRVIVVTGATGLQGSAVTRHLIAHGWRVRALTRNPRSKKAQEVGALGAELAQADMADRQTLTSVFAGAYGVFSVQNPMLSGVEGEIAQGKNVADAAKQAGVLHFVYSSAGPEMRGTGVPSWESKLMIADYIKSLGLPATIIRPMAFMELMTEKKFFPQASTWDLMPKLMGGERKVVWICTDDLGFVVAKIFENPERYLGVEIPLASDIQSIDECRAIYRDVMAKNPPRFPMPAGLFERFGFVGKDLTTMWRWLGTKTFEMDTGTTRSIHPEAKDVRAWLESQR